MHPTFSMSSSWASLRLQLSVLVWRHGALGAVALLVLLLSAVMGVWAAHAQDQQEAALRTLLHEADASIRQMASQETSAGGSQADPLQELRRVLGGAGPDRQASAVTGAEAIAAIMARRRLSWASTDYRETVDRSTGMRRVQMQIAVTAPYPQVRDLVEDLLRQMPQASVDALSVTREDAAQFVPTSRLTVSLWSMPVQEEVAP